MKTLKKLTALVSLLLTANFATSQATASATAEATIVAPIAIANSIDMNFGNAAVTAALGTVVLSPAGARSATGGVTLPVTTGTVAAAEFAVTGEASYTYAITLPSAAHTITHTNTINTMTVDNFTSTTTSGTATLDGSGLDDIQVGATLNVAGAQLAGVYSSGAGFDVTVIYN